MRYAIKNASGGYFTGSNIDGTRDSIEVDGTGTKHVHERHVLVPQFDGHAKDCARYETEADAEGMTKHPFLKDPQAFEGCEIVPIETA